MDLILFCLSLFLAELGLYLFLQNEKDKLDELRKNKLTDIVNHIELGNNISEAKINFTAWLSTAYKEHKDLIIPLKLSPFKKITICLSITFVISIINFLCYKKIIPNFSSFSINGIDISLYSLTVTIYIVFVTMAVWLGYAELKHTLKIKSKLT